MAKKKKKKKKGKNKILSKPKAKGIKGIDPLRVMLKMGYK